MREEHYRKTRLTTLLPDVSFGPSSSRVVPGAHSAAYESVELRSVKPFKAKWLRNRTPQGWSGRGFDTETLHGWARLLCTGQAHRFVEKGDASACFEFLLDQGPRLVAWNLRFDAEAVLKHLGEAALVRLLSVESLHITLKNQPYSIDLVPWKMLRITSDERSVEIFDVAPFFGSRLETAAQRFLGVGKTQGVDAKRINTEEAYWKKNRDLIVKYCVRDADLTQRLCEMVSERFVKLGGDFRKPYSVAFVAADILMRDALVPKLPEPLVPVAEDAFFGARFECLARGRFPHAAAYDIKSAYPGTLVQVEDGPGRWVKGRRPHRDALHAIVKCNATVDADEYPLLAPLPVEKNGRIVYPTGRFETNVLLPTYRRFEDILQPLEAWSFIPSGEVSKPYAPTVERLLRFRQDSDLLLKDSAKRGANSIYGKLLNQKTAAKLAADSGGDHWRGRRVVIEGVSYRLERVREKGLLYNPLHAGLITEACRLKMWDAAMRAPEKVLMIQADGLIATDAYLGKEKAQKAGDLGFVAQGDSVVCGSGVYEIKGYARRMRGVMFGSAENGKGNAAKRLKGKGWFTLLRGVREETVTFVDVRPAHLSECLKGSRYRSTMNEERNLGLKDVNVFLPFTRKLNVCRDEKRAWPKVGEARRLLSETFRSTPLHVEDGEWSS